MLHGGWWFHCSIGIANREVLIEDKDPSKGNVDGLVNFVAHYDGNIFNGTPRRNE